MLHITVVKLSSREILSVFTLTQKSLSELSLVPFTNNTNENIDYGNKSLTMNKKPNTPHPPYSIILPTFFFFLIVDNKVSLPSSLLLLSVIKK